MKTEDIDKRISMPDVDAEWARFEKEVIGKKGNSTRIIWLGGLSIAASVLLMAGLFFLNQDVKESKQILAEMEERTVPHEAVSVPSDTLAKLVATTSHTNKRVNPATDVDRKEDNIYDCVEENAVFPGGDDALMAFIKANMMYPDLALEYGARGMVSMSCIIDSVGEVSDIKIGRYYRMSYDTLYLSREPEDMQAQIKEQIALQLGEESTRILSLMPKWSPGRINGKPVNSRWMIPVKFNATEADRQVFLAKKEEAKEEPYEHLGQPMQDLVLQEQIASLDIVPNSGQLGPGTTMRLRGISTIDGKKQPLVVLDGKIVEIPDTAQIQNYDTEDQFANLLGVKPEDIVSIVIVKDTKATAKWGKKAKAGVIEITTKQGSDKSGKGKLRYKIPRHR